MSQENRQKPDQCPGDPSSQSEGAPTSAAAQSCPRCLKPNDLCVCEGLATIPTRTHILILQHPQEPDKDLGTARLAHLILPNSSLRIGLSWPNLSKALEKSAENAKWAVLYLGSGIKNLPNPKPGLYFVTRKAEPAPKAPIEGLVVLDGTWSQAKALWWRNPWLLKLKRVILIPSQKSMYGELRREPRRECLSTLESIAESLQFLDEAPEAAKTLRTAFKQLLEKQRLRPKSRARDLGFPRKN